MPHKTESALSMVLTMQPRHILLFMKSKMIKKFLDNPNLFREKPMDDKEAEVLEKELLRIELIATTVHYAETFASTLLAMRKYKRFHKFLLEYKTFEIRDFYEKIPKRRLSYIAKLLQYPQLHQIQPSEWRKSFEESIKDARDELKLLSEFYLNWLDFYNSYKHGFRVFASKPNPYEDDLTMSCFLDKKKLNAMNIRITSDSVDKAVSLCEFMCKFLTNAESMFSQRVLEKKERFEIEIFTKNKAKT